MEQVSMTVHDYETTTTSDSHMDSSDHKFSEIGMVRLMQQDSDYEVIKKSFVDGLIKGFGGMGLIKVVGIHKNSYSNVSGQTKLEAFPIFARAVAEKRGGDANIKYAWYGGTKEEICEIIAHGFGTCRNVELSHGIGVVLSPANLPMDSALRAEKDENGVRHVLLCRVILGNTECIINNGSSAASDGSKQFQPSSTHFDSGVDNPLAPTRYIVWRAYMNSHIFPNYLVSFTTSSSPGSNGIGTSGLKPSSPSVQLPMFLDELSKFVHPSKMRIVLNFYNEFMQNKSDRSHLIGRLRRLVGDKLLMSVIKFCRDEQT